MSKFTDTKGDEWVVDITVGTVKQAREQLDVLLTSLIEDNQRLRSRLRIEPELTVSILWIACEAQANDREITPEEFASRFGGDPLGDAIKALESAIVDFFHDPRLRAGAKKTMEVTDAAAAELQTMAMGKLEGLNPSQLARSYTESAGS